jgi:Tfp pilus assembly protein PilN
MRAVNLLPKDGVDSGRRLPAPPVLVACGGVVLVTVVLAMLFLSASSKVGSAQRELSALQAQYDAIPAPPPASPVVSQLPQQRQARVGALAAALGQRVDWDRVLREVSQVTPSDVWLTQVNAQAPSLVAATQAGAGPPTLGVSLPTGIVIQGCTYSQEAVAVFLARLDVVPDLSSMTLGKSEDGTNGGGSGSTGNCPNNLYSFQLNGNVNTETSPS